MLRIDEDNATIVIYPENIPGNVSRAVREHATQMLASDARTMAAVLSRHTNVVWKVTIKPYTGL